LVCCLRSCRASNAEAAGAAVQWVVKLTCHHHQQQKYCN
jgi:hypothetical protein